MSTETILLAAWLTLMLHVGRHGISRIRCAWRAARWYERLALCLLLVPIPGPVDELLALLVIRRVLARAREQEICRAA